MSSIDAAIIKHIMNTQSFETILTEEYPHEWTEDGNRVRITFTGENKLLPQVGDIFKLRSRENDEILYMVVVAETDRDTLIVYSFDSGPPRQTEAVRVNNSNNFFSFAPNCYPPDDISTGWFRIKTDDIGFYLLRVFQRMNSLEARILSLEEAT